MPALPASLALTTIAPGAQILSADHRNNYAAIQTDVNSLITTLGGGVTGQVLAGNGTTVSWVYPPGYEWNAQTLTATYANSTTVSYSDLVTFAPVTFDGGKVYFEVAVPLATHTAGAFTAFAIREAAAVVTDAQNVFVTTTGTTMFLRFDLTPAAGAHTYKVSWQPSSGTTSINATANGYIRARIVKA